MRIAQVRDEIDGMSANALSVLRDVLNSEKLSPALRLRAALSVLKEVTAAAAAPAPSRTQSIDKLLLSALQPPSAWHQPVDPNDEEEDGEDEDEDGEDE